VPKRKQKKASPVRPTSRIPWIVGGVDYGPAIAAVADIAEWAFELAARDVEEWPEGRRRVRNARRYVLDRLRGRYPHGVGSEDVLFAAGLLARIFESDLNLGVSDMIAVLDHLGLPTEVVPMIPRRQSAMRADNIVPFPPRRPPAAAKAEPRCRTRIHRPRLRNAA
jgi:hypothetical protein